jgi:Domain of Unknown Function (DUF1080)
MRRATRCAVILMASLNSGCSNPARPSPAPAPPGQVSDDPNTLTDVERAAGWRLLFDGRSTAGWRGFRQQAMPAGWQAVDGALTRERGGGDVVTTDEFSNFELTLEWRIGEGGNSGIMYRVSEAVDPTFLSGPEFQVIDNRRNPDGGTAVTSAAACYGVYAPTLDVTRPAGSWNQVRIVADRTHVEHWLNGVKVVEYELGSADWLARVRASMFGDVSTYGREPRGHIAFQDHGDVVAYRAVKIRPLP